MNNSRRKRINKSTSKLNDALLLLKEVYEEEQKALSKVPDDDEYVDMREGMDIIIKGLDYVITNLDDAINTLDCADF